MAKPYLLCGAGKTSVNLQIDGSIYPYPESYHRKGERELLGNIEQSELHN